VAHLDRAAATGRVPGKTPAGASGTHSPPAGSTGRTFTIALPAGMELLNANDRDSHWARRRRITGALREAAAWLARQQRIPALPRARILGVYEPPDRRRRDPANLYPSFKACVDGLVDAGVLLDDDAAHLDGPDMRLGEACRQGRLVLHITELAAIAGRPGESPSRSGRPVHLHRSGGPGAGAA
jgi:crossover junction endodeoxyribonuclease RusA